MNNYKICVYAICKNEEKFVDRWMDAVSEADLVVVTDTGSTDNTVEKLRARGAVVYEETVSPWRFDVARNLAMDHIPEDMDICVSNDMDEVFEKGWRQKLEQAWQPEHTRARYLFTYSFHLDGTPNKQFDMEKIHRRHNFRWVHPVHEVLEYSGSDPDHVVRVDMVLYHYPDYAKSRGQYLPLLELSAAENPQDDRTVFWLGREYVYNREYDKALKTLTRQLTLPTALWNEERSACMRFISRCHEGKGDLQEAKSWLFRAIAECPTVREPYIDAARLGYRQRDWPLVFLMAESALAITQKSGSYLTEELCWSYQPYDFGSIACFWLGLYEKAARYAAIACEYSPYDERLKKNLALIQTRLSEEPK